MLFTSPVFPVFFLVVFLLSRAPLRWEWRKAILLAASLTFYGVWNPPFTFLLLGSAALDYTLGRGMAASNSPLRRKLMLACSLTGNLGVLAVFKYANFLSENFLALAKAAGWELQLAPWNILLPIGISFYTFQTLSYSIDVYRRKLEPTKSLLDFTLFVTFFPQLVAGPIVRASEFLPQLDDARKSSPAQYSWAFVLFSVGVFKKIFLADGIFAPVANAVYTPDVNLSFAEAWVGTWAFAGQIYCDFSGYSDMAIACALALGFILPDNFRAPYAAFGFSDFWRRWHISLSSWLRDYLYIPLGGNRKGAVRTRINLMLTMLLGGLWHGASWNFVLWGGLHGGYLGAERVLKRLFGAWTPGRVGRLLLVFLTLQLVCIAWVPFRAETFGSTLDVLGSMAGLHRDGPIDGRLSRWQIATALGGVAALFGMHLWLRNSSLEALAARARWVVTALAAALLLFLAITAGGQSAEFVYFQF